jgi:hypothetical protein
MIAELFLDVSALEAPEPLVRTLAAADALRPGQYLCMRHRRYPCLLEENLGKRGFLCRIIEQGEQVTSYIWREGELPPPIPANR